MEKKAKAGRGDMMTAAQMAKEWGVPAADVKRRLKEAGVNPDAVRCGCSYYSRAKASDLRKKLKI